MIITIPKSDHELVTELARLDDQRWESLIARLETSGNEDLDDDDERLRSSLVHLSVTTHRLESSIPVFVSALQDAIKRQLDISTSPAWSDHIERAMKTELVAIPAKARLLKEEHPTLLREARIISDLRPVFMGEVDVQEKAAVIRHTLSLTYFDTSEGLERRIHLAADLDELQALQEALDRAVKKDVRLRTIAERAGLSIEGDD